MCNVRFIDSINYFLRHLLLSKSCNIFYKRSKIFINICNSVYSLKCLNANFVPMLLIYMNEKAFKIQQISRKKLKFKFKFQPQDSKGT